MRSCAATDDSITNVTNWMMIDLLQTVTVSLVRITNVQGPGKNAVYGKNSAPLYNSCPTFQLYNVSVKATMSGENSYQSI